MMDAFRIHSAKELCTEMLLELVSSIGICILNHPSTALQQFPMMLLLKLYYQYILFLLNCVVRKRLSSTPERKAWIWLLVKKQPQLFYCIVNFNLILIRCFHAPKQCCTNPVHNKIFLFYDIWNGICMRVVTVANNSAFSGKCLNIFPCALNWSSVRSNVL